MIISTDDAIITREEFESLEQCAKCTSTLVHGEQEQLRMDNDNSMNVSRSADPENAGVKITTDLWVKVCPGCGWQAAIVETSSYAGY